MIRRVDPSHADEPIYQIHEVYYDDNGEPDAFTERAIAPLGETVEELKADLCGMLRALDAPVLDYAVVEEAVRGKSQAAELPEPGKTLDEVKAELGL